MKRSIRDVSIGDCWSGRKSERRKWIRIRVWRRKGKRKIKWIKKTNLFWWRYFIARSTDRLLIDRSIDRAIERSPLPNQPTLPSILTSHSIITHLRFSGFIISTRILSGRREDSVQTSSLLRWINVHLPTGHTLYHQYVYSHTRDQNAAFIYI